MPFCKNCGGSVSSDQKFCDNCGAKTSSETKESQARVPFEIDYSKIPGRTDGATERQTPRKGLLLTLAVAALVIVVAFVVFRMATKDPLLGKWYSEDGSQMIEFTNKDTILTGETEQRYTMRGTKTFRTPSGLGVDIVWTYEIVDGNLHLSNELSTAGGVDGWVLYRKNRLPKIDPVQEVDAAPTESSYSSKREIEPTQQKPAENPEPIIPVLSEDLSNAKYEYKVIMKPRKDWNWGYHYRGEGGLDVFKDRESGDPDAFLCVNNEGVVLSKGKPSMALVGEGRTLMIGNENIEFVDKSGVLFTTPRNGASWAHWFNDFVYIEADGKYNLYNKNGKIIASNSAPPPTPPTTNGINRAMDEEGILYDEEGKIIKKFEKGTSIDSGNWGITPTSLVLQENDGKYSICNLDGFPISKTKYDSIYQQPNNLNYFSVEKDGQEGCIDGNGEEVVALQWDFAGDFSDGVFLIRKNKKYGFINEQNQVVIEPQFDVAGRFSEGLAPVEKDGKWGYIDTSGKLIIPYFEAMSANSFKNGFATIWLDDNNHYAINRIGEKITPTEQGQWASEDIPTINQDGVETAYSNEGTLICYSPQSVYGDYLVGRENSGNNQPAGIFDTYGNVVVPAIYEDISSVYNGEAFFKQDGYWGQLKITRVA